MIVQKTNNTIDKVRELQRKLYLAAKVNKKRKFHSLIDKIYRKDVLQKAWQQVKANKGTCGVDQMSIEDIRNYGEEKFLDEIAIGLKTGTYRPKPTKRVYIPKKDGSKRPLGIPVIKDRIVQAAVKIIIEPLFEADFKECSYGFRPKRNAHMALDRIKDLTNKGYYWIFDADIKGYFDSINHDKLMLLVEMRICDKQVLKLIKKWLKVGILDAGEYRDSTIGSPQGSVISPLLSNIYLNYLDIIWDKHYKSVGELIRYCDDFVIICRYYEQIKQVKPVINGIFKRLELTLHPEKTQIVQNRDGQPGFDFLGFHFQKYQAERRDGKVKLVTARCASKKSMNKMREKIRNILANRATLSTDTDEMIKTLNRILQGFKNYYAIGKFETEYLRRIDKYVVDRFTLWINAKNQKRYRRGNLSRTYHILKEKGIVKLSSTG